MDTGVLNLDQEDLHWNPTSHPGQVSVPNRDGKSVPLVVVELVEADVDKVLHKFYHLSRSRTPNPSSTLLGVRSHAFIKCADYEARRKRSNRARARHWSADSLDFS